jgi:hypothetical protein
MRSRNSGGSWSMRWPSETGRSPRKCAYREEVTKIAASPDPRKQKALQRFADGEQREAVVELREIVDADYVARLKAVQMLKAADLCPIAELAARSPT